ncbi:flippase [Patescibacteria group bacterium]|nr:flippase [Patescibacteria group bacterium]
MTQPKLAKNTMYLTVASVLQKAIAFLYFALIARYVGVEQTGAYFLALAIVTVVAVFEDIGITSVVIREVSKHQEDAKKWTQAVLGIKVFTIPLTVIFACIAPLVLGYNQDVTNLVWIAIAVMVADTLSLSFYGVLRGLQNLKYESLGIFFGQFITATLGIIFILTGIATLELLIIALVAGSLWNVLFSGFFIIKKLGWGSIVPGYAMGWRPIKIAFAFFLAAVFTKVYSYVDSIILSIVEGESAVGIYAVAYKLTYAFQFLPLAFVAALYPTMSAQSNDEKALKETLLNAFWYMGLMVFPIVFGIWALAPEIIHMFYGIEFAESALTLQILIFVLLFIFLDFPIGSLLNATDRQKQKTGIMGLTMVVNIVSNFIFIPIYGPTGAAIAGLLSFTFMFAAGWFFARKVVDIYFIDLAKRLGGLLLAGFIMAIVVLIVKEYVNFVITIPIGAVVYVGIAFLTKSVTLSQIKTAKRLLS